MKTGIPFTMPPLDPLSLDNMGFSLGGVNIEFRNMTMDGLSNHNIGEVTYDKTKRQAFGQFVCYQSVRIFRILRYNFEIPKLKSRARYSLRGKVLNLPATYR